MQLLQRCTLTYQEGTSDKVYEVDLCRVAEDRYVVNFRYGRRGKALKEGTKTVTPVSETVGRRLFEQLVNEKRRKGYQDSSAPTATAEAEPAPSTAAIAPTAANSAADRTAHEQALLRHLFRVCNNYGGRPANRVIWRVGELRVRAAGPQLLQFLAQGNPEALTRYCLVWALGRCGDQAALPVLEQIQRDRTQPEQIRRMAGAAIVEIQPDYRQRWQAELSRSLPAGVQAVLETGAQAELTQAVQAHLATGTTEAAAVLTTLYQIGGDRARATLLDLLPTLPLRPPYFQRLRHLFKLAEYHQDVDVFSLLAYRFDRETKMAVWIGRNPKTGEMMCKYEDGTEVALDYNQVWQQFQPNHPEAKVAYQHKTRNYLRRRVWRSLRRLGDLKLPEYVTLATAILLRYQDSDAQGVQQKVYYEYDRRTWRRVERSRIQWDAYAGYLTLNHILFHHSPRYELRAGSRAWRCRSGYNPGDPAPARREEAFPELWQQQPTALLRLLTESRCGLVHEFAAKALRACPEFCQNLAIAQLIQLLQQPYAVTAQLGFELAQAHYQPDQPNRELLIALANCTYAPAREVVQRWILDQRDRFLQDGPLIAALITSGQPDTQAFVRQWLSSVVLREFGDETAQRALIAQIIAAIVALNPNDSAPKDPASNPTNASETDRLTTAAEILFSVFALPLRSLGLEVILDLLRHPSPHVQTLGAQILHNHNTSAADLPPGLLDALLASPYDTIRLVGVQLFSQLPDDRLLAQPELLLTFITHELPQLRDAIRPSLRRLAHHSDFSDRLSRQLLDRLLQPEPHPGVHSFLGQLLHSDLPQWMSTATLDLAWQLLQAPSPAAQDLAGHLLQTRGRDWCDAFSSDSSSTDTLSLEQIATLTHHEMYSVRQAGCQLLEHSLPRLQQYPDDLLTATLILESRWDDAQQFGVQLFSDRLQPQHLTPATLISICDSTHPSIRNLGRTLIGRCFHSQDGPEYLLKFSEHPATDMQLFASQYLEDYASDRPDRLQELAPYFTRVLNQVNRARVAKQRIFQFLQREAVKDETSAQVIGEILSRQSVTIAQGEKAWAIETLLQIKRCYPQVVVPLQVVSVAVR